jgi:uracil-DNA glycosylase
VDQSWKYFDKIVLLGKEVNERLNLAAEYMPSKFIYIPHPSGLNRIWNNKKNYDVVVTQLEEFLKA